MPPSFLQRVRRMWAVLGACALVGFVGWCLIAYRAAPEAAHALRSDSLVTVVSGPQSWSFDPQTPAVRRVNLVFLAGAMVDPTAYAPLLHRVASHGYHVVLLALPWRGAFGKADGPDFQDHVRSLMDTVPGTWVVAGHSRGALIAALVSQAPPPRQTALALIGSTHPRDFSLAQSRLAVTKIYGTSDGVAPAAKVLANRHLLPATAQWVAVDGGNHHQFGAYGFQPGDHWAQITQTEQQAQTLAALLTALAAAPDAIQHPPEVDMTRPSTGVSAGTTW